MTMTMEETTTAQTLTAQREAARAAMTETPAITGTIFNIPAGYRVVEDEANRQTPTRDLFLVTAVEADSQSETALRSLRAAMLGTAVREVQISTGGVKWFNPGTRSQLSSYVQGAWVRTGAIDAPADKDILVCFADGTVAQWYSDISARPGNRSLALVHDEAGNNGQVGTGLDFNGQDWVQVERTEEERPFSGIPEGWKAAPTTAPENGTESQSLYVLSVEPAFLASGAKYSGTIQQGRPSINRPTWIFDGAFGGYYAEASAVNPWYESGKHYWLDGQKVLGQADPARVLRDTEHGNLLTVSPGEQWIEVVRDGAETSLQPGAGDFPYPNESSPSSPTLGLAASTSPLLDPEPVAGGEYVAWNKGWAQGDYSTLLHAARIPGRELVFTTGGSFRVASDNSVVSAGHGYGLALTLNELRASYHWIEAAASPVDVPEGEAASHLTERMEDLQKKRAIYSDALNDLAEENAWCSEFESVVQPMGFPGRDEMAKDYVVEVRAVFQMEDHGVSSWMDNRVSESVFSDNVRSLSLDSMSFSGSLVFTMSATAVRPARADGDESLHTRIERGITDQISDEDVESALDALLPGSVDVSEWTLESFEEDDN